MSIWQVIIGVLTALFVIYFRDAHRTAQKQKIVATRLRSYILHWNSWVLDNDLFNVFYLGVEWNKEIQETIKKGGHAGDLVKLKEEKRKLLDEIKKKIETEGDKIEFDKDEFIRELNKVPKNMIDTLPQQAQIIKQNLIEGKTFIGDEDASYLGKYIAQICVELKMNLISMIDQGFGLIVSICMDPGGFEMKKSAKEIANIIWKAILVSKDIDTLTKQIDRISSESLLSLTMRNLMEGL